MHYDPRLRNCTDIQGFTQDSLCTWIVYPPGAAGDLWGAIIGKHYPRTGNYFLGIDGSGKVISDTIDHKWVNFKLMVRDQIDFKTEFVNQINQGYRDNNFPFSMSGQCILVNHSWQDAIVEKIITELSQARVIRILPGDDYDIKLINWLAAWKNQKTLCDFESMQLDLYFQHQIKNSKFQHPRLLDLRFRDLWSHVNFEKTYSSIIEHLNLPYKMVRYDLVKFWFDCQHEQIKPHLVKLFD